MSNQTYTDTIRITTDAAAVTISQLHNGNVIGAVQITDRDAARDFGTFILHCTGNPSLHTNGFHAIDGIGGDVRFSAEDGVPQFIVAEATSRVELPVDDAIDLDQRLIVWAGVKQ